VGSGSVWKSGEKTYNRGPVQAIIAYIQKEWAVVSKAPFTFFTFAALFLAAGYGAGTWHYGERISVKDEELKQRDEQISRYRVALARIIRER
jgi:hypothetical protein